MRSFLLLALFFSAGTLLAQSPAVAPPYSPAVEANGLLFVSGQIGRLNGTLVTESFEAEAHQVMKNVASILADHALTFDDVVNVTIYLEDMKRYDEVNAVYRRYFKTARLPARVCVAVADLPAGAHVELAAVALVRRP